MSHSIRAVFAAWLVVLFAAATATAQLTTAITYQGQLRDNGALATGLYDMTFALFETPTGGDPIAPRLCANAVQVTGGNFIIELDFGAVFANRQLFLELGVRPDGRDDCTVLTGFVLLAPRQKLTISPQSGFSMNADSVDGLDSSFFMNASNLVSGVLPAARLPASAARTDNTQTFTGAKTFTNAGNVFAGSGAGLTGLSASGIASGVLDDARLSGNVARLAAAQTFSGANTFNNAANVFTGNGSGLTSLSAPALVGSINDARLSANIPRISAGQTFTGINIFTSAANQFTGSGAGLTALNASSISSGTLSEDRLPATLVRTAGTNIFSGANTFTNALNAFTGDGSALTGLNAAALTIGTIPDGRLPANLARLDSAQTFSGAATFSNPASTFTGQHFGTFSGSGAGLSEISASAIVGSLTTTALPTGIARTDLASQTFTGDNTFTSAGNSFNGSHSGSGAGLFDLPAGELVGTIPPTSLPANAVRTDAPVTFSGPVTFANSLAVSPTDRSLHLGPANFNLDNHTTVFTRGSTLSFQTNLAGSWWAPVHLPEGAQIVGITAELRDAISTSGADLTVALRRIAGVSGGPATQTDFAQVATFGVSPGGQFELRHLDIPPQVVDNDQFSYAVVVSWGVAAGNATQQQLKGVRIEYRITSPMP